MSVHLVVRLLLAIILAIIGWQGGKASALSVVGAGLIDGRYYPVLGSVLGAVVGFIAAPVIVGLPFRGLRYCLRKLSPRSLLLTAIGLIPGFAISALLTPALKALPGMWSRYGPLFAAVLCGSLGVAISFIHGTQMLEMLGIRLGPSPRTHHREMLLLDTSVIIDGRIADIGKTGFIRGTMLVPRFVLDELQYIADSPDALRRNRGRRGLEILNNMQKDESLAFEITDDEVPEIREVDGKLTRLAQQLGCPILTNDYNLNRVAELQGVEVLNINELANAVKSVLLPGESLKVRIIQEGRELGQGVGYLDDGTMVVIEDGRRYINTTVTATVTRVLQTVAGRMIFGQLPNGKRL